MPIASNILSYFLEEVWKGLLCMSTGKWVTKHKALQ